jgi:hypothetical protein
MTPEYVEAHTIFECIVGSQAYGTHNEFSDTDYAGAMIPGYEYFLGQKRVEQFQGYTDLDKTIFEIRKALTLVADNNPNMLDLLFTPERCIVQMHSVWEKIIENRSIFLSKRMRYTFSGYAIAQLDRIKTHRKFLLNPLKAEPKRSDFGLPEESMFPTSQKLFVKQLLRLLSNLKESRLSPNLIGFTAFRSSLCLLVSLFLKNKPLRWNGYKQD